MVVEDADPGTAGPLPGAESVAADRIRGAAIASFAESGYGGTSTREIARRLNMSAAAMYPHFRSKEELLYSIALEGHQKLITSMRLVDDQTADGFTRLRAAVCTFAQWQAEHRDLAKVVAYELHALSEEHYHTLVLLRRELTGILEEIIASGVRAGVFRSDGTGSDDTESDGIGDAVLAISSLCVDVCRWFPSRTHSDPQALGRSYAELAVRMVAAVG